MCRQPFREMITLNKPVICSIGNLGVAYNEHWECLLNSFPVKEYVADLNDVWRHLIIFMLNTQTYKQKYAGIRGLEHVELVKYEDEGRLMNKGSSCAAIKKKNGSTKVVVGCCLPCMSLRLVISPNDDSDIGQDDEYADEAVGYMNKQLEVCWKVFARLINKGSMHHMLVRKFQNVTCYLVLTGFHDVSIGHHFAPMKTQLRSLKECNFNVSLFGDLRKIFPPLQHNMLSTQYEYDDYKCCENRGD